MYHEFMKINCLSWPAVLALSLSACGDNPEERFTRAQHAFDKHDYTAARLDLSNVVDEQPRNAQALYLLARTYIELGDPDGAKKTIDHLTRIGQGHQGTDVLLGEAELLASNYEAALAAVAKEAQAPALRVKALANLGKNDPVAAAQAFAQGERPAGDRTRLLADYAHLKLAQGDLVSARRLAGLAAFANPRPLSSYLVSGDVAAADSQLGRALEFFDAALKAYPHSRSALLGKARILEALGRIGEARTLVANALGEDRSDPWLIYLDARLDGREGRWQSVRDKLQAHERVLGEQPDANLLYARALLELGQAEQARARLSSQILRRPNDRGARLLLGQSKLAMGDTVGAAETLAPVAGTHNATGEEMALLAKALRIDRDPRAGSAAANARLAASKALVGQLSTADKAMRSQDWRTAIQSYKAILSQTDGRNVLVLNNLAHALGQLGEDGEALGFAKRALTLAPNSAAVMDTAGWLLCRSGQDRKRGVALLQAASEKAPGNATIAGHLASAKLR